MSFLFIRNMIFASIFIVLLSVSSQLVIPIGSTPVSFQTMLVMIAGGILGARWGFISLLIWMLVAVIGFPVLLGRDGGLEVLLESTGGYLFGYLVSIFLIGTMIKINSQKRVTWLRLFFIYLFGGVVAFHLVNICWLLFIVKIPVPLSVFIQSYLVYLPIDLVKVVLATIITFVLYRVFPAFSPQQRM